VREGQRVGDVSTQDATAFVNQAVPTGGTVVLSTALDRKERDGLQEPQHDLRLRARTPPLA